MKTVVHHKEGILHVEAEGCIVNVHIGLTDAEGRRVTAVQVIPDQYIGEEWHIEDGSPIIRVVEGAS